MTIAWKVPCKWSWSEALGSQLPRVSLALVAVLFTSTSVATLSGSQLEAGRGVLAVERRISGIEIEKTFPHELIPKWGPPTRIEDATYGTTGSLTYRWERAGVRLDATVAYWTRDGQRCESPIQRVLVSGGRPTPDGIGRTGCGVTLGDGIDTVRACYGTPYRDYVIAEKGTTVDALPPGTRIVVFVWGADTRLELVFDPRGQRIISMELRVAEY